MKKFKASKSLLVFIPIIIIFIGLIVFSVLLLESGMYKNVLLGALIGGTVGAIYGSIRGISSLDYDESSSNFRLQFSGNKHGNSKVLDDFNHNVDLNEVKSYEVRLITDHERKSKVGTRQMGKKFLVFTLNDESTKFINVTFFPKKQLDEIIEIIEEKLNK